MCRGGRHAAAPSANTTMSAFIHICQTAYTAVADMLI